MIIPAGFAQINYQFTGTSVPNGAEITIGVLNGAGAGASVIAAAARDEFIAASIEDLYVNTCTMSSVLVKVGPNATGPSFLLGTNVVGGLVGAGASPQVALLLHKSTAAGGRMGRGRMYLPGVAEADVSVGGVVDSARVAAGDGFWATWITGMIAADLEPVLLHSDPLVGPTPITEITVDSLCATQRRRLRG